MKKVMMIMAMVAVIGMAGSASAGPILGGGTYYELWADGSNHDALGAPGWVVSIGWPGIPPENGDVIRYATGDTEFKMTVTGLTGGGPYDVAVLFLDQWDAGADASYKAIQAGLATGALTELSMLNTVEPGIGGNATSTGATEGNWYQVQSDPGVVGIGTASGAGVLEIFLNGVVGRPVGNTTVGGEGMIDGVVLTPIIPEPAGLGLIGLALLAVRRKRS